MQKQMFFVSEMFNSVVASVEKYTFMITMEKKFSRQYVFKMYFEEDAQGNSAAFEKDISQENDLLSFLEIFLSEFILEKDNLRQVTEQVKKMIRRSENTD